MTSHRSSNSGPIFSCAIDDVALASLRGRPERAPGLLEQCSVCGAPIAGGAAGSGLLLWARGDDVRADEPPLCADCATTIGLAARDLCRDEGENDGGGE